MSNSCRYSVIREATRSVLVIVVNTDKADLCAVGISLGQKGRSQRSLENKAALGLGRGRVQAWGKLTSCPGQWT